MSEEVNTTTPANEPKSVPVNDPKSVSKPTNLTKKERTPKQLVHDKRLPEIGKQNRRPVGEMAKKSEERLKDVGQPPLIGEESTIIIHPLLFLGGLAGLIVVSLGVWYFFLREKEVEEMADEEQTEEGGYVDSD